jgi:glutamate dehydrogenase
MLRSGPKPLDLTQAVALYAEGIGRLAGQIEDCIAPSLRDAIRQETGPLVARGVPAELARRVSTLEVLFSGCDIVRVAAETGHPVEAIARVYFKLGARCGFDWLRESAARLSPETTWQASAIAALVEDSYADQTQLTVRIVAAAGGAAPDAAFEGWRSANARGCARVEAVVDELRRAGSLDFAMLSVAGREIRTLLAR